MSLAALGWNPDWDTRFSPHREQGCEPARVIALDRHALVMGADGVERLAEVAGRLRHHVRDGSELPATGDWVALAPGRGDGPRRIVAVLPRVTRFARKHAGETTEAQIIAANIDTAFVVCGLDGDFNPRRIERYLAAVWDGGADPVVVLNKADLADDVEARVAEAESVAAGVPVAVIAAAEGRGLAALAGWLGHARTVALLGSSGVGKSTLVNALLGTERQRTAAVRADDSRGRHTTTRRELLALPGGAWLLDTPGLRELQLWADEDALDESFPEIVALADQCRFRDCRHEHEPGCAVLSAARRGELPGERLESWRKLQRELHWLAQRQDARLRAAEEARWRGITRSMRQREKVDPKLRRDRPA